MVVEQAYSKGCVTINVYLLRIGALLNQIHRTARGSSLGRIVEWSLEPFVGYVQLKAFAATETAHSLNRINLGVSSPVFDLDKGIMEWCPAPAVPQVELYAPVNQELLGFKGSICGRTGHVNCMVQQVPAFVIDLVDVSSSFQEQCDARVVPSNESILQSEEATAVHLVDIGTQV